jgi:hypothetical protein
MPCIKPTTKKDSNPYSTRDSKYSKKDSPYSMAESKFTKKENPFDERCLDYTVKLFQDGSPGVFQNNSQYTLNL